MSDKITVELERDEVETLLEMSRKTLADLEDQVRRMKERIARMEKAVADDDEMEELLGSVSSRLPRGEILQKVRDYLKANGPAGTSQIANALGLKMSSVSSMLNGKKEVFKTESDGRWRLP